MKKDNYLLTLKINKESAEKYYQKFLRRKSEQQKLLEKLLLKLETKPKQIADIACGSGTLTYHVKKIFPDARYTLTDINRDAIKLAKRNINNSKFLTESVYNLKSFETNRFELVFCWQTLSWLDKPEKALFELIRICKPGGNIFISSLFNMEHDVDIYSKVLDKTKKSAKYNLWNSYNTYSLKTINDWIQKRVNTFEIISFEPSIDIKYSGRGIGTFTKTLENGRRIQISAGMLLNWGILRIEK